MFIPGVDDIKQEQEAKVLSEYQFKKLHNKKRMVKWITAATCIFLPVSATGVGVAMALTEGINDSPILPSVYIKTEGEGDNLTATGFYSDKKLVDGKDLSNFVKQHTECHTINFPSKISKVHYKAYQNYIGNEANFIPQQIRTLTFQNNYVSVDSWAFNGCYYLKNINFQTFISIGSNAFKDCEGISGTIKFNESIESIGTYAFYGDNNITTLDFSGLEGAPTDVELTISTNAFENTGVTNIICPEVWETYFNNNKSSWGIGGANVEII